MKIFTLFTIGINLLLFIFSPQNLSAQKSGRVEGELIVQTKNTSLHEIISDLYPNRASQKENFEVKKFSENLFFFLLRVDPSHTDTKTMLDRLSGHPKVEAVQYNHYLKQRRRPDDERFPEQWPLIRNNSVPVDIGAEAAWDITTGGRISNAKDIVIAVIDDGFQVDHPDLTDNIFINHSETPGNGIDDDGNGYTDDYRGWNFEKNNDSLDVGKHGTPVAGIIGARGNNGIGIAGINWEVKILPLLMDERFTEAGLLAGYMYAYEMRKSFNESNGEKGAFIAATNSSWGSEGYFPDEFPIWCSVYDTLLEEGILNCVATSNRITDIEKSGDLPSLCGSESLIVVTNTDQDHKLAGAYGPNTVHIAAPGENILTLKKDGYGYDSGTSFASPVAAGVLGLMYSIPSRTLLEKVLDNPKVTALAMKKILLENHDAVESLNDKILNPGIINAFKAVRTTMQEFGDATEGFCPVDSLENNPFYLNTFVLGAETISSGDNKGYKPSVLLTDSVEQGRFIPVEIISNTTNGSEYDFAIWMDMNRDTAFTDEDLLIAERQTDRWEGEIYIPDRIDTGYYHLRVGLLSPTDSLNACGEGISGYEYEDYTIYVKKNPLLCEDPPQVDTIMAGPEHLEIEWKNVDSAVAYIFRYREQGSSEWEDERVDTAKIITIEELAACTMYEFQVRSVCYYDTSAFSPVYVFGTDCATSTDPNDYSDQITLFPNPSGDGNITVDLGDLSLSLPGSEIEIFLYSTTGREVKRVTQRLVDRRLSFSWNDLPRGMYLMRIQIKDAYALKKVIRQ